MPRRYLVITADDFGIGPERDKGIAECYQHGVITRTSLLVNGVSTKSAIKIAKEIDMPMGLHLNLSEGNPVSDIKHTSSLVSDDGYFHGMFGIREAVAVGKINFAEVETEIRAQIDYFLRHVGRKPNHVDGHQHVHCLPGIRDVFASVLTDYQLTWTRLPVEDMTVADWLVKDGVLARFFDEVVKQSEDSKYIYDKHDVRYTDVFFGMATMSQNLSVARIQSYLSEAFRIQELGGPDRQTQDLSCELMVHPGFPCTSDFGGCGDGPDDFTKSEDRTHEIRVLKDEGLRSFYKTNDITLCANPV